MERMLREKEVKELKWCTTKDQLADGLTKKGVMMDKLKNIVDCGKFC